MWSIARVARGIQSSRAMRYIVTFAAAAALCAIGVESAAGATLEEIKRRGYMIVATEDDLPPFEYVVSGLPRGYDNDLLTILRSTAGFEIRQEILPWQRIFPGVAAGEYDVALTAAVITDQAVKTLDFTMPIAESPMAYMKRKSDPSIKSLKDLSGKTLGVQQGGASVHVLPDLETQLRKSGGKLGKVVQYRTYAEAYHDLLHQRIDVVIHNASSLSQLVRETSGIFELGQQVGRKSYAAWAVKKGNRSLVEFLNVFLAEQRVNGTFARLQAKQNLSFPNLPNQPLLPGDRHIRATRRPRLNDSAASASGAMYRAS